MHHIISKDSTRIAYVTVGDGPPVVLVPGALNDHRGKASGLPLAEHLKSRFTVVAFDRRGRGESGDTAPWTLAREIDDLAALIERFGGKANVYGMSSGAMLALEAALAGVPIGKLALYEPPYIIEGTRAPIPPDYRARLEAAVADGRPGDAVELFLREAVMVPGPLVDQMKRAPMWRHLAGFGHSLVHDAAITGDGALPSPARLAGLQLPALVLDGGASPPWMRAGVRELATRMRATYRTLPDQTHDVDPAVLGAALGAFFA